MKQPKTFLLLSVIVAVLVLGVAYAAISNINLTVNGTATASPDQSNFSVVFGTATVTKTSGNADAKVVLDGDKLIATITATGFTKVNDELKITIPVQNLSNDLGATLVSDISTVATNVNVSENQYNGNTLDTTADPAPSVTGTSMSEYFNVTAKLGALSLDSVASNGTTETNLEINIKLIKAPIAGDVVGTFSVGVVAEPAEA